MSKQRITLAAGGTGGHVFPAAALGKELHKRGYHVSVLTDARGAAYDWDPQLIIQKISCSQISGSLLGTLKGGILLVWSTLQTFFALLRNRPAAIVGFGGYPAFATLLSGILLRIPIVVHQADVQLGRVNRWLAPYVSRIAISFTHTLGLRPVFKNKVVVTGLPLRPDLKPLPYTPATNKLNLLVTGGSQGARFFGEVLPEALKLLPRKSQSKLVIAHQCRPETFDRVLRAYEQTAATVELSPFFKDMNERYKQAHLILSRAGASSVLEAATVGRPALFVPYPFASQDHQTSNAAEAVKMGGAWCIQQSVLTPEKLATHLEEILSSPEKLVVFAQKISQIVVPGGVNKLARVVEDIIETQDLRKNAA